MRIVCIGDSLTKGSFNEKPLPSRLSEVYPKMDVVNLGVPGEITSQILARVSLVAAYMPVRVFVWAGINDIGISIPVATIKANLQSIYTYCAAFAEVVALTITQDDFALAPMISYRDDVNYWIKHTATGVSRVVDACVIVGDPNNPGDRLPAYADASSQNHINDAGIAAIVNNIIA